MKIKLFPVMFLLTVMAFAQTESDFNVQLTQDGTGVVITGYTGKIAAVRIPAMIQGMPVKEIGEEAFYNNRTITSIVIPEGITEIGHCAFESCKNLTTFNFPKSLTTLGYYVFRYSNITSVTIPETLTNMGVDTFAGCGNLKIVNISEGITRIPNGRDSGFFAGCTELVTINLPSTLVSIGSKAFLVCRSLTAIDLPASIEIIDNEAFSGCTNLTTVTIPKTVEKIVIYHNVFAGCSKLPLATQAVLKRLGYTDNF
jgi:hypothetical protein